MNIYNSSQRITEIDSLISKGFQKGYQMPFACLDDFIVLNWVQPLIIVVMNTVVKVNFYLNVMCG